MKSGHNEYTYTLRQYYSSQYRMLVVVTAAMHMNVVEKKLYRIPGLCMDFAFVHVFCISGLEYFLVS